MSDERLYPMPKGLPLSQAEYDAPAGDALRDARLDLNRAIGFYRSVADPRDYDDAAGGVAQTIETVVAAARAEEREACAKVCEDFANVAAEIGDEPEWVAMRCAENIRARSALTGTEAPLMDFAWVIEDALTKDGPLYYGGLGEVGGAWTRDHLKAVRYARREDAERAIFGLPHGWHLIGHAVEHGWARSPA